RRLKQEDDTWEADFFPIPGPESEPSEVWILFEGVVRADPKVKYPLCLEGARACPPEDCGGVWGYADFVEAIQKPDHERRGELLEGVGGSFDPEGLDPVKATKGMRKGLPDWRSMAGW